MKKTLLILAAIAGAAFVSCQKETNPEPTEPELTGKTYTLTVNATKAAGTKALAFDGANLVTSWAATDEVKVCKHGSATAIGTLLPKTTGSASTSISGSITLTDVKVGDKLDLIFPDTNWTYEGQDGTLATLASSFDFARAEVTVSNISGSDLTASAATFTNEQSLVKFTILDADTSSLMDVQSLMISASSGKLVKSYAVSGDAYTPVYGDIVITPAAATSEFYVALRNNSGAADTYTLTAKLNQFKNYTFVKSGVTFANGHYKAVNVKMTEESEIYTVAGNLTEVFGSSWNPDDANNDMAKQSDGTYRKTYQLNGNEPGPIAFKVVKNRDWTYAWPSSNYEINTVTKGTLVITFDPSTSVVNGYIESEAFTIAGDDTTIFGSNFDPTDTNNDMVKQDDGTFLKNYTITDPVTIRFKVAQDHKWNNSWGDPSNNPDEYNYKYVIPHAGTLHISFDPTTHDVDAWMDDIKYSIAGSFNSWDESANIMTKQADGTYKCTVANPGVTTWEYKAVLGEGAEWYGDSAKSGNNYSYEITSPCDLVFTFNPADKSVTVEESRVTLYFNIARSCNNVALLSSDLGTAPWPGDYNDGSVTIGEKLYYKWSYPTSVVEISSVSFKLIDKDYWGMDVDATFIPSGQPAYYFYMDNSKVITELSESEVNWKFRSQFTGVDWDALSWLGSNGSSELADWKATSDDDNIYVYFKIVGSAVQSDRYIYSGYNTDNDNTTGSNAGGNVNGGYEGSSLLYPFTTDGDSNVVCKNGLDSSGWIKYNGTTVSGVKIETYGEIKTDYAHVEMRIPRTAIGSPASGQTIQTNHSYHWYVAGDKPLVLQ